MKKTTSIVLGVMIMGLFWGAPSLAGHTEDFKIFQRALKDNPRTEAGKDAKWFKLLVTDAHSKRDRVKITLPLSLVEAALRFVDDCDVIFDHEDCDINVKALLKELKKAGPMALIEVYEDGEIIKIWLE